MPEETSQEETGTPDFTPLLQAYRELRERYPDFLISVKVGELYMLYGKDAEIAAPIINSRTLQMELQVRDRTQNAQKNQSPNTQKRDYQER